MPLAVSLHHQFECMLVLSLSSLNTTQVPSRATRVCFTQIPRYMWSFFHFQCNAISQATSSSCGAPFQSPVSKSGCLLTNNTLTQKLCRIRDLPFNKTAVLSDSKAQERSVSPIPILLTTQNPPLWFQCCSRDEQLKSFRCLRRAVKDYVVQQFFCVVKWLSQQLLSF